MNAILKNFLRLNAVAAAVLAALGPPAIAAEGDEVTELSKPESSVSVGIGHVSKDNQRFGQYTGLNEEGGYGLLDLDYIQRDDATGTWVKLNGRNLGLDNRDLRFEHERQGDWGYFIDYSEIPRFDPFTVNTGLQGLGSTTQTTPVNITPGTGTEYHLDTQRDRVTLGFKKYLPGKFDFNVRYRHEEKDGNRLFGQGTFSNWRFLTDPIDQTTQQIDATLNYTTENLQLTGGYYGTSFNNNNSKITTAAPPAPFPEAVLPPDNQSHQLYLAGGYNFSKLTRATFKLAYARITQDDAWSTTTTAGAPGNLDGQVDTTLVQAGLTAHPMPKLSLRADLRYEDRDDKTPVFNFFPASTTTDGTNEPRDIRTTTGRFEADYRLPMGFRVKGGVEYEEKKRNSPPVRSVDFRETTEESIYNVELRRSVSQTVTGAVSLLHSKRDGSSWLPMIASDGVTPTSALIAPLHLIDRDRDTVRLTVNWIPADSLSLNFRLDESRDDYTGRGIGGFDLGPREGRGSNYSLDAAYLFSDEITGTAWYSRNENEFENALCRDDTPNVCTETDAFPVWGADLSNIADSFGLGLRAKMSAKLDIGADLTASKVRDEMDLNSIAPTNSTAVTPLPDINTRVTTLKLYGKYALDRSSGVRLDYIHDRYKTDDWTWANWIYSDGTTVTQDPDQKVNFVGLSYYYRWR